MKKSTLLASPCSCSDRMPVLNAVGMGILYQRFKSDQSNIVICDNHSIVSRVVVKNIFKNSKILIIMTSFEL